MRAAYNPILSEMCSLTAGPINKAISWVSGIAAADPLNTNSFVFLLFLGVVVGAFLRGPGVVRLAMLLGSAGLAQIGLVGSSLYGSVVVVEAHYGLLSKEQRIMFPKKIS